MGLTIWTWAAQWSKKTRVFIWGKIQIAILSLSNCLSLSVSILSLSIQRTRRRSASLGSRSASPDSRFASPDSLSASPSLPTLDPSTSEKGLRLGFFVSLQVCSPHSLLLVYISFLLRFWWVCDSRASRLSQSPRSKKLSRPASHSRLNRLQGLSALSSLR